MSQDANICRFTVLFSQNVETTIAGAKEFLKERRPRKKATEQEEKKARHYDDDERVITEIGRELDVEMVGGMGSTCNRKSTPRVPLRILGGLPNTLTVGHNGDSTYVFLSFQCAVVMGPLP